MIYPDFCVREREKRHKERIIRLLDERCGPAAGGERERETDREREGEKDNDDAAEYMQVITETAEPTRLEKISRITHRGAQERDRERSWSEVEVGTSWLKSTIHRQVRRAAWNLESAHCALHPPKFLFSFMCMCMYARGIAYGTEKIEGGKKRSSSENRTDRAIYPAFAVQRVANAMRGKHRRYERDPEESRADATRAGLGTIRNLVVCIHTLC